MNNLPFLRSLDMSKDDTELIVDIYKSLKVSEGAEINFDYNFEFEKIALFGQNKVNAFGPVFMFPKLHRGMYLVFVDVTYNSETRSLGSSEYQAWGILKLKSNYGRIVIKTESILDKVLELVNPIDLDFEDDKIFSSHFHVITEDVERAKSFLTYPIRQTLLEFSAHEFLIEIFVDEFIVANKKVIFREESLKITELLKKVSQYHN